MKTPSVSTIQLSTSLAALLPALLCLAASPFATAQVLKHPIALRDRSQSSATRAGQAASASHSFHFCGTGQIKHEHVDPDRDHLTTIPHWSGSFNYHGINYPYTMVGTDPRNGSATTVVPTEIIPLRFVFADGSVADASTDLVNGQTAIHGIVNSPLFQAYPFVSGGTKIGNTQYLDAFQRGNFWSYVSTRSPDYHVLLGNPKIFPAQTINVPADKSAYIQDPYFGSNTITAVVDLDFLQQQRELISNRLGISPKTLPIFVTGPVAPSNIDLVDLALGYHGTINTSSGAQTYIVTSYYPQGSFNGFNTDVSALSHEINEWLDDPFTNNYTPGWDIPGYNDAQCDSYGARDSLEVCDPLSSFLASDAHPLPVVSFTYHVVDSVFLDFFLRSSHSTSVGGQYSFFGAANSATFPCTGHLELNNEIAIAYPGAVATNAFGMNNRGQVVGVYEDGSGNVHGFITDGNRFASIDPPGSIGTYVYKINDAGVSVGPYYTADGLQHGFSYQNGRYTNIDFPGAAGGTSANGINSTGDIVGQYWDVSGTSHGFIFNHGHYQRLDVANSANTDLTMINDSGLITGNIFADFLTGPYLGFVRDGGHYTNVSFPGALAALPQCINNSNMLAGIFANQIIDGAFYGDGFVTVFGYPYEIYGETYGINDRGQVVGSTATADGVPIGFTGQLPVPLNGH